MDPEPAVAVAATDHSGSHHAACCLPIAACSPWYIRMRLVLCQAWHAWCEGCAVACCLCCHLVQGVSCMSGLVSARSRCHCGCCGVLHESPLRRGMERHWCCARLGRGLPQISTWPNLHVQTWSRATQCQQGLRPPSGVVHPPSPAKRMINPTQMLEASGRADPPTPQRQSMSEWAPWLFSRQAGCGQALQAGSGKHRDPEAITRLTSPVVLVPPKVGLRSALETNPPDAGTP